VSHHGNESSSSAVAAAPMWRPCGQILTHQRHTASAFVSAFMIVCYARTYSRDLLKQCIIKPDNMYVVAGTGQSSARRSVSLPQLAPLLRTFQVRHALK
jgi:hypothetical protein